jgi:hypothetical protein
MFGDLDVQVRVVAKEVRLGGEHHVEGLEVGLTLNQEGQEDNIARLRGTGRVLPGAPEPGKVLVEATADLGQAHPPFELRYDIDRLPTRMRALRQLSALLAHYVPLPFMDKLSFADEQLLLVSLDGDDRWRGVDARAFRKSLISRRNGGMELPAGHFDLGFDFSEFLDPASILREVEAGLSPLKALLEPLRDRERLVGEQVQKLRARVEQADRVARALQEDSADTRALIETLKPLAEMSSLTKRRLAQAQEKLEEFEAQVERQRAEEGEARQALARLEQEKAALEAQVAGKEAELEAERQRLAAKVDIADDPFAFDFEAFGLSWELQNPQPWQGEGELTDMRARPTSRFAIVRLSFTGQGRDFPDITGWWDLDGRYEMVFKPSAATLRKLDQRLPILGTAVRTLGGIGWGPDGFDPRLAPR